MLRFALFNFDFKSVASNAIHRWKGIEYSSSYTATFIDVIPQEDE